VLDLEYIKLNLPSPFYGLTPGPAMMRRKAMLYYPFFMILIKEAFVMRPVILRVFLMQF